MPGAINNRGAAVQLRFVPLFAISPTPSYHHHYSQTSISRNRPGYSPRDEDKDGRRRVKGLYKLIRVEGVMIESVDGRELLFPKRLLRGKTKRRYNALLFGHKIEREQSIDPIHSTSLLLVCLASMHYILNINAFYPRPINFRYFAEFAKKSQ